jgi:ketopantoate reductase
MRQEIHSEFAASSERITPVDLVLFAVKSQDTEEAARALAPFVARNTAILSLQNGVDNADKIGCLWGGDGSLAGVAYISARMSAPGVIEHSGGGRIVLGSLHVGGQENARTVHGILAQARSSSGASAPRVSASPPC